MKTVHCRYFVEMFQDSTFTLKLFKMLHFSRKINDRRPVFRVPEQSAVGAMSSQHVSHHLAEHLSPFSGPSPKVPGLLSQHWLSSRQGYKCPEGKSQSLQSKCSRLFLQGGTSDPAGALPSSQPPSQHSCTLPPKVTT